MNKKELFVCCAVAIQTVFVSVAVANPQAERERVSFTDLKVSEFKEHSEVSLIGVGGTPFDQAVQAACTENRPPAAPLVTAIGGILIDWAFSRIAGGLSVRLQKRIAEHTASYSTPAIYRAVAASDDSDRQATADSTTAANGGAPAGFSQTCVVMQRIECQSYVDDVKKSNAQCIPGTERVGFSAAVVVREEPTHLRVLPIATHLGVRKAKHHTGNYVVSTTFRIQGISYQNGEGSLWVSPETKAFSQTCFVGREAPSDSNCSTVFPITNSQWQQASVLPVPPRTVRAPIFTVGEVGQPSRGLKGFAEFLGTQGDDMSAALSEALKLKIGLKDE